MLRIFYVIILLLNIIHFIYCCEYPTNFEDGTKCLTNCGNKYYKFVEYRRDGNGNEYPYYICLGNSCDSSNPLHRKGEKECLKSCGTYFKYEDTCYEICNGNVEAAQFSYSDTIDNNVCIDGCPTFYLESNKVCIDNCNLVPNKITYGKKCVDKCYLNSDKPFLVNDTGKLICDSKCSGTSKRYSKSNYICEEFCAPPNNYVVNPEYTGDESELVNVCLDKCPENKPYMRQNNIGEYICSNIPCGKNNNGGDSHKYFYMDTYICLEGCGSYYMFIDEDDNNKQYCVSSCDFFKNKQLYHYDVSSNDHRCITLEQCNKKITKTGRCSESCDSSDFTSSDGKICYSECPLGTEKYKGTMKCLPCGSSNHFENENGICVPDCRVSTSNYIYNDIIHMKCVINCSPSDFIEGLICTDICNKNRIGKYCFDECPLSAKYYEKKDSYNECLPYCETDYFGPDNECLSDCEGAYIDYYLPILNTQLCFKDGNCQSYSNYNFPFTYKKGNQKYCDNKCPSDKPYYMDGESDNIECLSICKENSFHSIEKYICYEFNTFIGSPSSYCPTKVINYDTRECVYNCSYNSSVFYSEACQHTFCVEKCNVLPKKITNSEFTLLSTTDRICVTECPQYTVDKAGLCDCIGLYYREKRTQYKKCLNPENKICKKISEYPISVINENDPNECTDICYGTLSSSGYECYPSDYTCNKEYEKPITLINGRIKCECIDKYYYNYDGYGIKIKNCLKSGNNCPENFNLLIAETRECVKECSGKYNIKYMETCVDKCPDLTEYNSTKRECECKIFYIDKDNNPHCLENCIEEYPVSISHGTNQKQCLERCQDDMYLNFNEKECIDQCSSDRTTSKSEINAVFMKYANNVCRCKNKWYYDEIIEKENCTNAEESMNCSSITYNRYKYLIYSTNQCVSKCPDNYKKEFDYRCFNKCEGYTEDIVDDKGNKCKCRDIWKKENNNIKCIPDCPLENLLINDTRECVNINECPKEYPLLFNRVCYKEGQCPDKGLVYYYNYTQECKCKFNWTTKNSELNIIECLIEGVKCPSQYPYYDLQTKECISNKENSNKFHFNYNLYSYCPENTEVSKDKDKPKECVCTQNKNWYSEMDDNGVTTYHCSLDECPIDKPYDDESNDDNRCKSSCGEKHIYIFKCYSNCPNLTELGRENECILSPVNYDLDFSNLEETMVDKVTELYVRRGTKVTNSSQKIMTKDAIVQFYGVNKDQKDNSLLDVDSDLSFINISNCINKLYNTYDIKEDIIILKFDLYTPPDNFMINPVEYKFIDSESGEELDGSVCEHHTIRISYPIHELISKFDSLIKQRNLEFMKLDLTSNNKVTLREKVDKGKEIIELYPDTDTFNIDDKLYSDICIPVQVDKKDLVLIDRINYFHPQMSLCENNCTYNHTDFYNERIYCDCNFKKEFDFKRIHFPFLDINMDKINKDQGGNLNLPVIKCISILKDYKSYLKNGGFIYMVIIILIEIVLLFLIIFHGINSIIKKFKEKIKKDDIDSSYDDIKLNVAKVNINEKEKEKEIILEKETERNLNGPPKKKKKKRFDMEFIPPEYLFLFFGQNDKGIVKKVVKDNVPFKTGLNTRILLQKNKGVNYTKYKSHGPFPEDQNVIVIVDNINDSISDYIYDSEISVKKPVPEKSFSQVSKIHKKRKLEFSEYDPSDDNYSEYDLDEDDNPLRAFLENIKQEHRLLKKDYKTYKKNRSTFSVMILAEILDKIYITNIILFRRKFDILGSQLSIYVLCHAFLIVLLAMFYDIKTIRKIWNKDNFPGAGYYLLYGLLSCIIIWLIYRIILCLWSNNDKIKELLKLIHFNNFGYNNDKIIYKKYKNLIKKLKIKIIIFTIIEILLLAFCFIYFVTFCAVFIGTKTKVFISYAIALAEVLIIKILYAIILAFLRKLSLDKGKKVLYEVVRFMDTYLV